MCVCVSVTIKRKCQTNGIKAQVILVTSSEQKANKKYNSKMAASLVTTIILTEEREKQSNKPTNEIAPLGLAGGRSYDRTNALRTPTMKESQLLREKPLPRSLFQHVQTLCMPSFIDLHTHATPGHVTSFACSRNTSDRSLA